MNDIAFLNTFSFLEQRIKNAYCHAENLCVMWETKMNKSC